MSILVHHLVLSPRESEKRDKEANKGEGKRDTEEGEGKMNDSSETEEILTCPLPPPAASTTGP